MKEQINSVIVYADWLKYAIEFDTPEEKEQFLKFLYCEGIEGKEFKEEPVSKLCGMLMHLARHTIRKSRSKMTAGSLGGKAKRKQNASKPKAKRKQNVSSSSSSSSSMSISKKKDPSYLEAIYQAYPRKMKPKDAKKAIEKALKKIDPKTLLAKVEEYAKTISWKEKQYIPYPASWFNAESWNEDPVEWEDPNAKQEPDPFAGIPWVNPEYSNVN